MAAGIFILIFPGLSLVAHFVTNDRSSDIQAYEQGQGLLRSVQRNALFFAEGDDVIFPVVYFQQVLHRRMDVTLVPASYLWTSWGGMELGKMELSPGWRAPVYDPGRLGQRVSDILDQLIRSNRGRRPVQFTAQLDLLDRCYFSHQSQVLKDGSLFPFLKPWGMTLVEDPDPTGKGLRLLSDLNLAPPTRPEEGGSEVLFDGEAQAFFNAAEYGVRTHQGTIAERFYPVALRHTYDPQLLARIWEGWGDYQAGKGSIDSAREAYMRSIAAQPTAEGYARLIRSYFEARQYEAALRTAERCVQIFPDAPQAQQDLALCQTVFLAASRQGGGRAFQKNKAP
jgi:hypothetical protein